MSATKHQPTATLYPRRVKTSNITVIPGHMQCTDILRPHLRISFTDSERTSWHATCLMDVLLNIPFSSTFSKIVLAICIHSLAIALTVPVFSNLTNSATPATLGDENSNKTS